MNFRVLAGQSTELGIPICDAFTAYKTVRSKLRCIHNVKIRPITEYAYLRCIGGALRYWVSLLTKKDCQSSGNKSLIKTKSPVPQVKICLLNFKSINSSGVVRIYGIIHFQLLFIWFPLIFLSQNSMFSELSVAFFFTKPPSLYYWIALHRICH